MVRGTCLLRYLLHEEIKGFINF
uniref:Uncharacterized protein n=1 Tax=Arundo donax TaxID=35708 RepID=A0A0A8ZT96_ARUDO